MKCPVCKKEFDVLWPSQWAYKRGNQFICSWGCIRRYDRKEADGMQGKAILTEEQRTNALEMALNGENPLPYLKKCGAANPTTTWKTVRKWAEEHWDKAIAGTLPERFGKQKKAEMVKAKEIVEKIMTEPKVELVYDDSIAEEYRAEHPELFPQTEEKVNAAERLPIASVWSRVLETGTYTKVNGIGMMLKGIDYQMMMSAEDWRKLAAEIPVALEMLEV